MTAEMTELVEYLDRKFAHIDGHFEQITTRLNQHHKSHKILFKRLDDLILHVDTRFDAVNERFEAMEEHFDQVDARLWVLESDYKAILNNLA